MTPSDTELVAQLMGTFEALASSVPDHPPLAWEDVLESFTAPTLMAPVLALDGSVMPPATTLSGAPNPQRDRRGAGVARRIPSRSLIVATTVAACVAMAAVLIPFATQQGPEAAAAILRTTALRAAAHGVLSPSPGQALEDFYSIEIQATQNSSSGASSDSAMFQGDIQAWTAPDGSGQERIKYGSPRFASPASAAAWVYSTNFPMQGDTSYSAQGPVISMGPAIGAFDVSSLPTDPAQLAVVLAQASTGIKGLDQIQGGSDVVYDRIALLLSTPLVGSSPALESAIYQVLAQVPGIESLGTMTDHSGRTGTAFTQPGSAFTLIVDTSTGSLLEIFEHPVGITDTTSGSSVGTEALLWLDPTNEQLISVANVPAITAH
jgi:hypothetical protein